MTRHIQPHFCAWGVNLNQGKIEEVLVRFIYIYIYIIRFAFFVKKKIGLKKYAYEKLEKKFQDFE